MKEIIKDVVIAAIIAIIVIQFIRPTVVKESSMEATLFENNYIFLNKQAYTFGEPKRGDIIVFHSSLTREDGSEELFLRGDHRRGRIDSRYEEVGCVKIDDVVGKAFFRLFPFRDIGKL